MLTLTHASPALRRSRSNDTSVEGGIRSKCTSTVLSSVPEVAGADHGNEGDACTSVVPLSLNAFVLGAGSLTVTMPPESAFLRSESISDAEGFMYKAPVLARREETRRERCRARIPTAIDDGDLKGELEGYPGPGNVSFAPSLISPVSDTWIAASYLSLDAMLLSDLPLDVLQAIIHELKTSDGYSYWKWNFRELSNLGLTCRVLGDVTRPYLYRRIGLSNQEKCDSLLQILARNKFLSNYIHRVDLYFSMAWVLTESGRTLMSHLSSILTLTMNGPDLAQLNTRVLTSQALVRPLYSIVTLKLYLASHACATRDIIAFLDQAPRLEHLGLSEISLCDDPENCPTIPSSLAFSRLTSLYLHSKNIKEAHMFQELIDNFRLSGRFRSLHKLIVNVHRPFTISSIWPLIHDASETLEYIQLKLYRGHEAYSPIVYGPVSITPQLTALKLCLGYRGMEDCEISRLDTFSSMLDVIAHLHPASGLHISLRIAITSTRLGEIKHKLTLLDSSLASPAFTGLLSVTLDFDCVTYGRSSTQFLIEEDVRELMPQMQQAGLLHCLIESNAWRHPYEAYDDV
jgi:hypothetical protein